MMDGVAAGPLVVPVETFVNISSAAHIVAGWIAVASKDVNKSSADALHEDRGGIPRASENDQEF